MDLNLDLDLLTSSYDYHLPKSKIALTPAIPLTVQIFNLQGETKIELYILN